MNKHQRLNQNVKQTNTKCCKNKYVEPVAEPTVEPVVDPTVAPAEIASPLTTPAEAAKIQAKSRAKTKPKVKPTSVLAPLPEAVAVDIEDLEKQDINRMQALRQAREQNKKQYIFS